MMLRGVGGNIVVEELIFDYFSHLEEAVRVGDGSASEFVDLPIVVGESRR